MVSINVTFVDHPATSQNYTVFLAEGVPVTFYIAASTIDTIHDVSLILVSPSNLSGPLVSLPSGASAGNGAVFTSSSNTGLWSAPSLLACPLLFTLTCSPQGI